MNKVYETFDEILPDKLEITQILRQVSGEFIHSITKDIKSREMIEEKYHKDLLNPSHWYINIATDRIQIGITDELVNKLSLISSEINNDINVKWFESRFIQLYKECLENKLVNLN